MATAKPKSKPSRTTDRAPHAAFLFAGLMLALAFAFPIALMVLNPTLMFERGWHQFAGAGVYFWAILMLGREWLRLRGNEAAFAEAPALLKGVGDGQAIPESDQRLLPARLRRLAGQDSPTVPQLMDLNAEVSGLDQERVAARFTLTKYILYLLPVIGFMGTVEGISRALMKISVALPLVKELDGFLNNLTGVTDALQIAFDSTLLALFLSAALMFVQTIVYRLAEDQLARVDGWVVERVLPALGRPEGPAESMAPYFDELRASIVEALSSRLGAGFGPSVDRFAEAVGPLPAALGELRSGSESIARAGLQLAQLDDSLRRLNAGLGRIETTLETKLGADEALEPIRRGLDRTTAAVESLADRWTTAYERSSRTSQEQLGRTLASLKDALEMIHVSAEQSNALYRSIVKKMFDERGGSDVHRAA